MSEYFTYFAYTWDIEKAWDLVHARKRNKEPEMIEVAPLFDNIMWGMLRINKDHVDGVDPTQPILFGLLKAEGKWYSVLIDGHHRLWKAYHSGIENIPYYALTKSENHKASIGIRKPPKRNPTENIPPIDGSVLRHLYLDQELSISKIGRMLGFSSFKINKWLRYYKIPLRRRGEYKGSRGKRIVPPGEDTLRYLYITQGLLASEIADIFDVSRDIVGRWLDRYKIKKIKGIRESQLRDILWREKQEQQEQQEESEEGFIPPISKDILQHLYLQQKLSAEEIGRIAGVSFGAIINWLKKYNIPRRDRRKKGMHPHSILSDMLWEKKWKKAEIPPKWHVMKLIDEGFNTTEIANYFGVRAQVVLVWLQTYGIKPNR